MSQVWVTRAQLAETLAAGLAERGWSQRELARLAEVDPKTVRNVLSGRGPAWVTVDVAERLLRCVGGQVTDVDVFCAAS